ncbi:hypothetical protein CBS101457_001439 [Exobasidium rhododendri]|nr:hypothetical protein CBS101457_001439 [Exobasidium rhododendri]
MISTLASSSNSASGILEPRENMSQTGAQDLNSSAIISPTSSISTSVKSEASSKAGSQLSKSTTSSSTATANTSANKVRSIAPTLDAIAARMKKTNMSERAEGDATSEAGSGIDADGARLSRLPLPGRLSSNVNEGSDSSHAFVPPAPIAVGVPPTNSRGRNENLASLRDKAASRSRSASPTKPQAIPARALASGTSIPSQAGAVKALGASSSMNKEMPSLQDIIDRMSKKGLASSSSSDVGSSNGTVAKQTSSAAPAAQESAFKIPAKRSESSIKSVPLPEKQETNTSKDISKPKTSIKAEDDKSHPLQHKWTMYFDSKSWNPSTNTSSTAAIPDTPLSSTAPSALPASTAHSWEAALKMLGVYTSVEAFMSIFSTLRRPSQLERNSNYHLFKNGIKPMWEDAANQKGGKWIITIKTTNSALLDRSWMWLVLALIGEELDENDDVTGAVVSTRSKGDRIALWIRNKTDVDLVNKIGKKFVHLLDLEKEPGVSLEFSPNSVDDGSSKRALQQAPSKFINFTNPPTYNSSPNFVGGVGGTHQQAPPLHRLGSSPGKTTSAPINRIGMPRRGSEQNNEGNHHAPFPMGVGTGLIGRTVSPSPSKNGIAIANSSNTLLVKSKFGSGLSPPR